MVDFPTVKLRLGSSSQQTMTCVPLLSFYDVQDGGYHVQYAHKDLASNLNLKDYNTELHEVLSLQTCSPAAAAASGTGPLAASTEQAADATSSQEATTPSTPGSSSSNGGLQRVAGGRDAAYAFVYPNFMANRYGWVT